MSAKTFEKCLALDFVSQRAEAEGAETLKNIAMVGQVNFERQNAEV